MIPEKVRALLAAHGLTALEFEAGATATSVMAAARIGVSVGQIAKTLLFLGRDGRLFMVVAPGDRRISAAKLKAVTGTKSRMARTDEALAATGFGPGGVCPFAVDPAIPILVDRSLSQYGTIYPAAGTDSSGVPMTCAQLVDISGARVEDLVED
jgi:prolyl-tRNA editing enzyme YbaK/EbsC (Cys-tRNA(Pro) deacylase)